MTGARIIATFDAGQISGAIRRVGDTIRDATQIMEPIGRQMVKSTRARMDGPTDATGKPYAPLNPAYAAVKRGPGILRESLQLERSVTFHATSGEVLWGSNKDYAAIHQFGGKIVPKSAKALVFRFGGGGPLIRVKSVTIPARPYLGIDEEDEMQILRIVDGALVRALRGRSI